MKNNDYAVFFLSIAFALMATLGVITKLLHFSYLICVWFQMFILLLCSGVNWYLWFQDEEKAVPLVWIHRSKYYILYYFAIAAYALQLIWIVYSWE